MKSWILSRNGFVSLVLLVVVFLAGSLGSLEEASYLLYDKIRVLGGAPDSRVMVVAIDEHSMAMIGDNPISNQTHLRVLENLLSAGVALVGYTGLRALNKDYAEISLLSSPSGNGRGSAELAAEIRRQGRVIAGITFVPAATENGSKQDEVPDYLMRNAVPGDVVVKVPSARPAYSLPADAGGPAASYAGVLVDNDNGRIVRDVPLFIQANGMLLPTMAMQMYLLANKLLPGDVSITDGGRIAIGERTIALDEDLHAWPYLYQADTVNKSAVEVVSYHDVLHGAVDAGMLNEKIVLLGVTARGLVPAVSTPAGSSVSPVMLTANTLASMFAEKIILRPAWASYAANGILVLVAVLVLWFFGQSLKARLIVSAGLVLALLGIEALLMHAAAVWINLYPPLLLLLSGLLVTSVLGRGQEQGEKHNAMSGEVHRRVGLASQKRGELDAAFESFRKCPLDNSIMVLLFYLAQDFENAGRFDRAVAVYQYMESFNPHYKDLQDRLEKARMMEDTVMIDQSKIAPAVNTAITSIDSEESDDADDGQQYLGRYRVEQEIGKGAMGLVYQGTDPKINRTVAIKTLNLKQEFDEDEQENVLGRFFHEAEAAGRLHHPHIVTIYDAGEHNDLAYIAMEFLTGSDLRVYTKQGMLLPPLRVVKIGMKLAGALSYAHSRDIIHRDIKAANVMYDPGTGQLKITDFGIARLTDSRRTKTGMVLGTPSSMSPEQLRGKKLDGRTDLYSLGVLMFQLLTGRLPYKAESLTQLMYKITNEAPPDLFALRPELKDNGLCIKDIIDKLLQKDADDRYQDGKKLARDLLVCAKKMAAKK